MENHIDLIINDFIIYLHERNRLQDLREIVLPSFMKKDLDRRIGYGDKIFHIKVTDGESFQLRFR